MNIDNLKPQNAGQFRHITQTFRVVVTGIPHDSDSDSSLRALYSPEQAHHRSSGSMRLFVAGQGAIIFELCQQEETMKIFRPVAERCEAVLVRAAPPRPHSPTSHLRMPHSAGLDTAPGCTIIDCGSA
jgi:hypothetical protein